MDTEKSNVLATRLDPDFDELLKKRARLTWTLTLLVLVLCFGFILAAQFMPGALVAPLPGSEITTGLALSAFIHIALVLAAGVYVFRANTTFDALTKKFLGDFHHETPVQDRDPAQSSTSDAHRR